VADHLEQQADIFVPGGEDWRDALRSVTHLAIGAHADDCEFMAFHGIEGCRRGGGKFGAVVLTDGAGSVGGGEDLRETRRREQRTAAELAGYAVALQLGLSSAVLKNPGDNTASGLLSEIFAHTHPRIVYAHNPCDRHDTHVASCLLVIEALRALPPDRRPHEVYGCEVWRDLDWLCGDDRIRLNCGIDEKFASGLNAVFRSQIQGGKRYDLAVIGRRRAQATFDDPHAADDAEMVTLAMDLTPLLADPQLSVSEFAVAAVDRFRNDVRDRLHRMTNG
jgi:hypothetical protein